MNWQEQQIQSTWENGLVVEKVNPTKWRKDACGAWIAREHYDDCGSCFGWVIEEVDPDGAQAGAEPTNLRPCQWKNFGFKKNGKQACPVIANGGLNLDFSTIHG
jgi:hypothetical protein